MLIVDNGIESGQSLAMPLNQPNSGDEDDLGYYDPIDRKDA